MELANADTVGTANTPSNGAGANNKQPTHPSPPTPRTGLERGTRPVRGVEPESGVRLVTGAGPGAGSETGARSMNGLASGARPTEGNELETETQVRAQAATGLESEAAGAEPAAPCESMLSERDRSVALDHPGPAVVEQRDSVTDEAAESTDGDVLAAFTEFPTPRQPLATEPAPAAYPALRPTVTELRLSAFKSHRGAVFPLGPVTVFAGDAGTGKSSALEALVLLSRLAAGDELATAIQQTVSGGVNACAPDSSRPDDQGRRGFHLGCTVNGPSGEVRLDLAVQTEPELRVVGERLTGSDLPLLTTALRDPSRSSVQAAWYTAGAVPVTRAPLPDDRLATALLPLRVAGTTQGQRLVIEAAEQMLIGLRAVFPVAPVPSGMRSPSLPTDGMLRAGCDNLSAVLNRTNAECRIRHGILVDAVRSVTDGPLDGIVVTRRDLPPVVPEPDPGLRERLRGRTSVRSTGTRTGRPSSRSTPDPRNACGTAPATAEPREGVMAALDRGPLGLTPVDRLGDSQLRFLALALVLLTGPGVLEMDQGIEVPPALRAMTVVADGFDAGLDHAQTAALLAVARRAAEHGHVRVLATTHDPATVTADGITVIHLRRGDLGGGGR
ncbi:ATP-binding protein [Streptantibioticus silvisoli]|uniref:ATP-binding protein n=1 Tax=Streptantibioticus silvisoli TaxID=2705255 RepID=UPI003FD760D1